MSDTPKAVFLSYAREDTDAARRIADGLRGAGVEVWFDQAELRGGDAWDAKIKQQIRDCALFLPVISARTQARAEGYFRREWKQAVERTRDLADHVAFIVPVVIDETAERGAHVPEAFLDVQWTRLPGGAVTPEFAEQVKRLLAPALDVRSGSRGAFTEPAPRPGARPKPKWAWAVAGGLAVVAAVFAWTARTRTGPLVSDRSIAVLPFENRSEDKANAFFTDGIHEDILTNLAHIAALRVVSRTSVMEYRGTTKKIRQIGQELGVAWLLEGSVQRYGNKVRVTGQLINARTDEHVWAQSYDRDLTDIFAIQSAVAQEIAGALRATLSPREKSLLERPPTVKPEAYDLVLRARQIDRDGNDTRAEAEQQQALLEQATQLDPNFAGAWGALAVAHGQFCFNGFDTSEARLAQARDAIETARRLDPENPLTILTTGSYYYFARRDYPRALEQFERIAREWPNDYLGHFLTGLVQRRKGQWVESLATLRRAAALDPRSPEIARNLMISLRSVRRFDEAKVEQARRVAILPESLREAFELNRLEFMRRGSTREMDELLAGPVAERAGPEGAAGYRKLWAVMKGDLATAARLEREFPDVWGEVLGNYRYGPAWGAAILAAAGDAAGAQNRAEKGVVERRARLMTEPGNAPIWANLGLAEAILGHKAEALAAARRAMELMPESRDTLLGAFVRGTLVFTLAWVGEKDAACAELERLLAEPSHANVHELRASLWLAPLKGHPRFEALLNDPKNNAPLF